MDQLIFYILNSDKQPLYDNGMGGVSAVTDGTILKPDGSSARLKYSPSGWQGTLIKYTRNIKYLGMTRDFTVPLDFVEDGGLIIKDTKWRYGRDAVLYLSIFKATGLKYPEEYEHFYTGELDLSKAKQQLNKINVPIVEGDLAKLLKAGEDTVYDLPIDTDGQYKVLYFTGFPFTNRVEWTIYDGQELTGATRNLGMGIISQEGYTQGVIVRDETFEPTVFWEAHTAPFESYSKSTTVTATGEIVFTVNVASAVVMSLRVTHSNSTGTDYFIPITSGVLATGDYSFNYTRIIPIVPGDQITMVDISSDGGSAVRHTIKKSSLVINYDVTFDPTKVQGLSPKRVLRLLLNRIAPTAGIVSTFLDSLEDSMFLTSGQALRKFMATANFKTSLSDFFKHFQRDGICLGIEGNNIVIEHYSYFFRTGSPLIDIGEIADYDIEDAIELMGNTYKFGYPIVDLGKVNGRDEFNTTDNFVGPGKRVVKELNFVSPYQAGMYPIESARISFFGQDTTDSNVDNTPYVINTKKGATYDYFTGPIDFQSSTEFDVSPVDFPLTLGVDVIVSGTTNDGTYNLSSEVFDAGTAELGFITGAFATGIQTGTVSVFEVNTYILNRPAFTSISGLLHPTLAFNVLLDPKSAMINNGGFLRAINDFNDFNTINYTAGDRNSELVYTIGGNTITEKANEVIGGLATPLFCPYYITIRTKGDVNYNTVMQSDPYLPVAFSVNGFPQKGYIWDGGCNPATDGEQTWKLLLAPGTDLTKFIKL